MSLRIMASRRNGFVLLTVVFLIMFCSLMLVGMARMTLHIGTQSAHQLELLQQRWGQATLEKYFFQNSEKILQRAKGDQSFCNNVETSVRLGELEFESRFSDEQAKANLSTILENRSLNYLDQKLRSRLEIGNLALRPSENDASNLSTTRFNSWGQVFDLSRIPRNDLALFLNRSVKSVTLWGRGGRLHYSNASSESIRLILELALTSSEARRWIQKLEENREADVPSICQLVQLTDRSTQNVKRLLTDNSTCFSLMVTTNRKSGRSFRYTVAERVGTQRRTWVFQW